MRHCAFICKRSAATFSPPNKKSQKEGWQLNRVVFLLIYICFAVNISKAVLRKAQRRWGGPRGQCRPERR